MRYLLAAIAIVGALLGAPSSVASAQEANFCGPGQAPRFVLGFATLKEQLGPLMGEPVECEHPNNANGDTLQTTTTGLAYYRKATNTPTFTDGFRHWASTVVGLVYWEGPSADPPSAALSAPSTSPPAAAPPIGATPPSIDRRMGPAWRELMELEGWNEAVRTTLERNGVRVIVGPLPPGAVAGYQTSRNVIIMNETVVSEDARALAAVLAHEAMHVEQYFARRLPGRGENCVRREVEALTAEVLVWRSFWNGYGPDRTPLQRLQNFQLRVYDAEGEPGLRRLIVNEPGYQRQCAL